MSMTDLTEHLKNRPLYLKEAKQQGKKVVGTFPGNFVPEEVIHAAGAIPLCLVHAGNARVAEAGMEKVPQVICPFARSLIGEKMLGENPFFGLMDMLVAPITCQHLKKVSETYEYEGDVNLFKLGVPLQYGHDFETEYFAERIKVFIHKIQELTGNEITNGKLLTSIELYNKMRGLLKKISLMRRMENPPITTSDFVALNHISYYADPQFMVDQLESEYQRLRELKPEEPSTDKPRILLIGPNLGYGDTKVPRLVEEAGGMIVIEEICEGMRYYWQDINTHGDLIQSLVQGYLVDRLPCAFMRDSSKKRLDFALELIRDFNVNAVIWYELVCCETYDSEAYYFANEMEKRNIPTLILESDYTSSDTGQLKTRIEAFMEIVRGVV